MLHHCISNQPLSYKCQSLPGALCQAWIKLLFAEGNKDIDQQSLEYPTDINHKNRWFNPRVMDLSRIFKGPNGEFLPCFAMFCPYFTHKKRAPILQPLGAPRRSTETETPKASCHWPPAAHAIMAALQLAQLKTSSGDLGWIFVWFLTCTYIITHTHTHIYIYILYLYLFADLLMQQMMYIEILDLY